MQQHERALVERMVAAPLWGRARRHWQRQGQGTRHAYEFSSLDRDAAWPARGVSSPPPASFPSLIFGVAFMRATLAMATGNANAGTDEFVGKSRRVRRSFDAVMRKARSLHQNKVAAELAAITGKSVRTAERWLSGELTPDGESTLALFLSDMGPEFLATAAARLTPARQESFWREMGKAQKRADFVRRQAALDREKIEHGIK